MPETTATDRDLLAVVHRLAAREAQAHLVHPVMSAWTDEPAVTVSIRVRPCPVCGTRPGGPGVVAPATALRPVREVRVLADGERQVEGSALLVSLWCEALTGRALVPLVAQGAARAATVARTRAATVAELHGAGVTGLFDVLTALDAAEEPWSAPGAERWTLPAATRYRLAGAEGRAGGRPAPGSVLRARLRTSFASPHLADPNLAELADAYRAYRLEVAASALVG
ncbi:hypothetical protein [Cellulomonas wangsupingiae]|uniref:hypothetical protein n=1 Tax=Cellulomonas wangsupingiae TaxID=2968085 RepID=UPI001D0E8BB4|nr:hypothetical protein [Cellulomonas wangsupingiae]MCM0640398.1 hypothetical protein [Cellulomonas wangsupingiae]